MVLNANLWLHLPSLLQSPVKRLIEMCVLILESLENRKGQETHKTFIARVFSRHPLCFAAQTYHSHVRREVIPCGTSLRCESHLVHHWQFDPTPCGLVDKHS